MFRFGKCPNPNCSQLIRKVGATTVVVETAKAKYQGVTFICPICATVLSVSLDPLIERKEIVAAVVKALAKG